MSLYISECRMWEHQADWKVTGMLAMWLQAKAVIEARAMPRL
jgi:hypothetical protein